MNILITYLLVPKSKGVVGQETRPGDENIHDTIEGYTVRLDWSYIMTSNYSVVVATQPG